MRYFLNCLLYSLVFCLLILSCTPETYTPITKNSNVNFNIENVPYNNLSEYLFFEGNIANQTPTEGVLPFEPISKLFTDYAEKKRFIWMPDNVKATYNEDHTIFNFPEGTVLIKTFYYNNVLPDNTTKIIETRMLIKKGGQWILANYVWNDTQTDAFLDTNNITVPFNWLNNGVSTSVNYKIPSAEECLTCHKKNNTPIAIGVKPQHLNSLYPYQSGSENQLQKWIDMGYLQDTLPNTIQTLVNWEDTSQDLELRARSYLDINCAHCHSEGTHCSYRPIRFGFENTEDPINLGICVIPDEDINPNTTHVISPGRPEKSGVSYRLSATDEAVRMPLIGRTLIHQEGVDLINEWITSLTATCD